MYNALGMRKFSAELLLLVALLGGAWMVRGRADREPVTSPVPGRAVVAERDPVVAGLSERTERLRAFIATPRPPVDVRRNPFRFPASAPPVAAAGALHRVEVDSEAAAPRPELTLSGIAEDQVGETTVRTAVINAGGQLVFVKEGDRILSRFLVVKIASDAVRIKDTERDEVFTLAFK